MAWAWIELAAVIGALSLDLWWLRGLEGWGWRLPAWGIVLAAGGHALWRRRGLPRPPAAPLARAWGEAAVAGALLTGGLLALAALVREPYDAFEPWVLGSTTAGVAAWGLGRLLGVVAQQIGLQVFLRPLALEVLPGRALALGVAAAVFGLLHLPNPVLAVLTGAAAAVWMALYQSSRRLAPLVVLHVALTLLVQMILPPRLTWDLRVGVRALESAREYRVLGDPETRALLRRLTSDDYYALHGGTDRGFLEALYRDLLGREPDPIGLAGWERELARSSRAEVARGFVTSPEFVARR